MGGASLQSAVRVGDGTACIIVQVNFNVAADNTTQCPDQVIHLSGRGTADGICNAYTVDANLVDSLVERKEIDQIGPEGVFAGKADLNALGLDVLDDLDGGLLDIGHVLTMRMFPEEGRGADDNVDAVDAGLDGNLGILHVASDVGEDLGLEAELADGFTVLAGLLRGGRRGQLYVVGAKLVESLCNFDLLVGVEVGIGKSGLAVSGGATLGRSVWTYCSPSLNVLSMTWNLEMLLRKSPTGWYGFRSCRGVARVMSTPTKAERSFWVSTVNLKAGMARLTTVGAICVTVNAVGLGVI